MGLRRGACHHCTGGPPAQPIPPLSSVGVRHSYDNGRQGNMDISMDSSMGSNMDSSMGSSMDSSIGSSMDSSTDSSGGGWRWVGAWTAAVRRCW